MILTINNDEFTLPKDVLHDVCYYKGATPQVSYLMLYCDIDSELSVASIETVFEKMQTYCCTNISLKKDGDDTPLEFSAARENIITCINGYEQRDDVKSGMAYFILFDFD